MSTRSKPVSAIDIQTGEETLYPSLKAFADAVGCTYVHASRVISEHENNRYYITCKGYSLRYLDEHEKNDRKDEIIAV